MILGLGFEEQVGKKTVAEILRTEFSFKHETFKAPVFNLMRALKEANTVHCTDFTLIKETTYDSYFQQHYASLFSEQKEILRELILSWAADDTLWALPEKEVLHLIYNVFTEQVDAFFWVNIAKRKITKEERNIVFTDITHITEKNWLDQEGVAVLIKRNHEGKLYHANEHALQEVYWFYIIDNNCSIEQLKEQVRDLYHELIDLETAGKESLEEDELLDPDYI